MVAIAHGDHALRSLYARAESLRVELARIIGSGERPTLSS
jgi:hypothetical protein